MADPWAGFELVQPASGDPWSGFQQGGGQPAQAPAPQSPAAPVPAPVPEGYGLTDSIWSGVPGADEAGALGGAVGQFLRGDGWDYSAQLEKQRGARKAYGEANPGTQLAGDIAAGMAFGPGKAFTAATGGTIASRAAANAAQRGVSGTAGTNLLAPTGGAARAAAYNPAQYARGGTGLGAQMAQGAKQGAIVGGISGVADEGDVGQRLAGGALSAGFGAGVGATVPAAFALSGQIFSRPAASYRGYTRPDDFGLDKTVQGLERSGRTAPELQQMLDDARMGGAPQTTLADAGGDATGRMVRTSTNIPGRAGNAVREFLDERQVDAQHRVLSKLQQHWGGRQANVHDEAERLIEHARTTAGPIYDQAYAEAPPVNVQSVVGYIDSVISPGATGMARPRADLDADSISGQLAKVRRMLATNRNQRVGLQELHRVKMDLDGMIEKARSPTSGSPTLDRHLNGVKELLLREMDIASPAYGRARGIFAGDMRMTRALEQGRKWMRRDAEVISREIARMTPAELTRYRAGVYRDIQDRLGRNDMAAVYDLLFKGDVPRTKLRAVFNDDAAFNDFTRFMLDMRQQAATRRAAQGNSSTVQQGHDVNDAGMDPAAAIQFAQQAASGNVLGATLSALGRFASKLGGWNEESAAAAARYLLSVDPAVQAQVLARLGQQRTASGMSVRPLIERALTIEIAGAPGRAPN